MHQHDGACAARDAGRARLRKIRQLVVASQYAKASPRTKDALRLSFAMRVAHERDLWGTTLYKFSDAIQGQIDLDPAIHFAMTSWTPVTDTGKMLSRVRNAAKNTGHVPPDHNEVKQKLATGVNEAALVAGGVQLYLGLAAQTATEAGQVSLAHLGINKTFAFASPRNMASDMYAVRGSKVIQSMYGDHMDRLTQLIVDATDPRHPKTIAETRKAIKAQWPDLQRYQVDRIARTETAAVWTSTSANAYAANGITQFESSIAQGPSIGIDSEDPCDDCVDAASDVHSMDDDIPPWHPNCRCEAIPVLEDEDGTPWLPPDEPWTGGASGPDYPVCGSSAAVEAARRRERLLKMGARIRKDVGDSCFTPAASPDASRLPPETATQQALVADGTDWNKSLSSDEKKALKEYQNQSQGVNSLLRRGKLDPAYGDKRLQTHFETGLIPQMDAALSKMTLTKAATVYRGTFSAPEKIFGTDDLASMVGKTWTDAGYMSTSAKEGISTKFLGRAGVRMKIEVPAGANAGYIDSIFTTHNQQELILPRGSQFEITAVQSNLVTMRLKPPA